jgi:hypothetical protein
MMLKNKFMRIFLIMIGFAFFCSTSMAEEARTGFVKNEKLSFIAQIKKGTVVYLTGLIAKLNHSAVRFETPTAVCGIRGTHFAIKVEDQVNLLFK